MKPTTKQLEAAVKAAVLLAVEHRTHKVLCLMNDVLGLHGVEVVVSPQGDELSYLNTGETYDATLAFDDIDGTFVVTSWGGWFEDKENEHAEATGKVRCGYCSAWTPMAENWEDTRCESCGHNVQDGRPMPAPVEDMGTMFDEPDDNTENE